MNPIRWLRHKVLSTVYSDESTGVPNRTAFNEMPAPVIVAISYIDDHRKWLRVRFAPDNWEPTVLAQIQALKDEGISTYRMFDYGGEMLCRFVSEADAIPKLDAVTKRLAGADIEVLKPDGRILTFTGIELAYGIGSTLSEADGDVTRSKHQLRGARGDALESPWLMWLKDLDAAGEIPKGSSWRVSLSKSGR